MPYPLHWPPRHATGRRSLRVYLTGTATANFADNAILFGDVAHPDWNPYTPEPVVPPGGARVNANFDSPMGGGVGLGDNQPAPMLWCQSIAITATTADLEISFADTDNTLVQGFIPAGQTKIYRDRYEAGIAIRGGGTFHLEAW